MSENPREAHIGAVHAAKYAVGECQGLVSNLTSEFEAAIGLVANATGGQLSSSESGRNAFQYAAGVPDKISEVFRQMEIINSELDRYINGF